MSETRSTWRIYAKQWLFDSRHPSEEEAEDYAIAKYRDRLAGDEVRVEADDLDGKTWVLWTHRWAVLAESKYEEFAVAYALACESDFGLPHEHVKVIQRNSRAEHVLLQHGVLKMAPSAQ